ncbi:MAG TPA: response regulator transcription factor [Limnochordia bacterium]|nr:response regulator transcription factor [Limnochordia bacterium]HPZ31874.1 response regulator transcription factor [Limnochordia bacterium]HQD71665.1 response regulator transcription factor [Limnochordia bacterium]
MVYYVEDDASIRGAVLYALNSTGFEAEGFEDGESFFEAVSQQLPDIVLLDIMLPGIDGLEVLERLRADRKTADIPVILITAKGSEFEKVIGLDSGADDYVAKPFGVTELISRIKAVLRRVPRQDAAEQITVDGLTIDIRQHTVTIEGKEIDLTLKEFNLLHCLMRNEGRVFTRDELLDIVWGYDAETETRTVDVHIGTIRQKLGEYSSYIKTVRGLGYRFARNEGK